MAILKGLLKLIAFLIVLVIIVNVAKPIWNKIKKDMVTKDGKHSVLDSMVGKTQVDTFIDIRDRRDTFNLPGFKTGLMMFYTQHGRFPRDMIEIERSGIMSHDLTHDRFGNPFELKVLSQKDLRLFSAGKDKIKGTTDDLKYQIPM